MTRGRYPRRKVVSPAEMTRAEELKRPRKGEATYAETCGKDSRKKAIEKEYSDDSEGWTMVERRKRERRALEQVIAGLRPGINREARIGEKGAPRGRRRKEAILVKVEEGYE